MKKLAGSIILITYLSICQAHLGFAERVTTYEDLLVELSEGKSPQHKDKILEIIKQSQKSMIDQYSKQGFISSSVSRYFKFKEPIAVHHISDQYFAVSFNAETTKHNFKKKVIWVLFFNRSAPGEISYAENFFSWEKPDEIAQYINTPEDVFCKKLKTVYGIDCKKKNVADSGPKNKQKPPQEMVTHLFFQNEMKKKADIGHLHSSSDIIGGKINASFIDEAICRDSELNEAIAALKNGGDQTGVVLPIPAIPNATLQRIDLLEMQMKENLALRAEVKALKETVQQLTRLLAGVTRKDDEITFSGVNIHLVNGSHTTDGKPNSRGNLIVGYNEASTEKMRNARNGSHNVIIGKNHSYTSFGGLVVGESNSITEPCAVVSGGLNNTASGKFSTVSGGQLNIAKGDYSTVSGGLTRKAEKNNNWVGGNQYSPK
jgi:hypothetical protein